MSTNDVPGANPRNNDALAMGCWAEHSDGSLILVESTEGNRVIYSIFDTAKQPPLEYRDAMPEVSFKSTFSWDPSGKKTLNEKWTWHDKTPFPWEKVIKDGFKDGQRSAAAEHTLNAAERIIESRERHRNEGEKSAAERVADKLLLEGRELDRDGFEHRMERTMNRVGGVLEKLAGALSRLPGGKSAATKKGRGARK